ncbi:MAG: peptidyl-prolyl cis-trans isomerase [Betaproteobacteria bacterium]|nr:peptidyl-prolyl cis-trans isomerase [Betaproteobacteria bacterium]
MRTIVIALLAGMLVFSGVGVLEGEQSAVSLGSRILSQAQLNEMVEAELARLEDEQADDPEVRARIESGMRGNVAARFVALAVIEDAGLAPTEQELIGEIRQIEDFQVEDRFSRDRFNALVTDENEFIRQMEDRISIFRFSSVVSDSILLNDDFVDAAAAFIAQQRRVRKFELPIDDFKEGIEASEEEMNAYYSQNQYLYVVPERVRMQVADIRRQDMEELVEIDEEGLRELFEQRNQEAAGREERQLQLIVVADEAAASRIYEQAIANPDDFAQLAKDNSLDAGSRSSGGDMGFLTREDLPPEVAEPVFAAEVPAVIEPIEIDGNWQVYRVAGLIGASQLDYDEMRDDLVVELRREQSLALFEENAARLEDQAYVLVDELEPLAASGVPVSIYTTDWVHEREYREYENPEDFQDADLLEEIIDLAATSTGASSGLISAEVGERYLIVKILEHEPRRLREFDDVAEDISENVITQKALQAAAASAEQIIKDLLGGEDEQDAGVEFSAEAAIIGQGEKTPEGFHVNDINAAFAGINVGDQLPGYAFAYDPEKETVNIIAVEDIIEQEPDEEVKERLSGILMRNDRQTAENVFLGDLIDDYDVNYEGEG